MSEFLEERLPISIRMGATYGDDYAVEITRTASGKEYRRLIHPYPTRYYNVGYLARASELMGDLLSLYHRCYGMYSGFRVKCLDDFTTNNHVDAPTPLDMPMIWISNGVYQLQKNYGAGSPSLSIGLPTRTIFKPVLNTTVASIAGVTTTAFTVDTTTGIVTFTGTKNKAITGITKAASAVVTVTAHTFIVSDVVYFSGISGMTQMNGLFGTVTAVATNTITVNINSAAFGTWTSGGTAKIIPGPETVVKGGCEFDIPFRFNSRIQLSHLAANVREVPDIEIVELIDL